VNLTDYRKWRRKHYADGTPRDAGGLDWLLEHLLSTRQGAIEIIRSERRYAKYYRKQHTPPMDKDAGYFHEAYGRKRGKNN